MNADIVQSTCTQIIGVEDEGLVDLLKGGRTAAKDVPLTEEKYAALLIERCKQFAASFESLGKSLLAFYQTLDDVIYTPSEGLLSMNKADQEKAEKVIDDLLKKTGTVTRIVDPLYKLTKLPVYGSNYASLAEKEQDRLRRLVSSYYAALQEARDDKVLPGKLAAYIHREGGIEALRRRRAARSGGTGQSTGSTTATPDVSAARDKFLAAVKHEYPTADCFGLNKASNGKRVILFGTYRDGSIEVHGVTTHDKVFSLACDEYLAAQNGAEAEIHGTNDVNQ